MDERIASILEQFPFLTYGTMSNVAYLGIVQNCDAHLLSMYLLDIIQTEPLRKQFLACGTDWWWGSNRAIPINIFLKERFLPFRPFLRHFSRKDFVLQAGPSVSLQELTARRVRKRQIVLVQRTD